MSPAPSWLKSPYKIEENPYGAPLTRTPQAASDGILIPSFPSSQEAKLFELQADYSFPHSRPGSVAIVTTGTMWRPGSGAWKAVMDMFYYTYMKGLACWFQEVRDPRSGIPYSHLGAMMDHGLLQSQDRGFQYTFLIQTDILPKPDLLIRLLSRELPILAPLIIDPLSGKGVGGPMNEPNQGLKRMRWIPFPCLLIENTVLNCVGHNVFTGLPSEDFMWHRLSHYGHRPWQDTDQVLEMATHATRHGNLTFDEQMEWFRSVDERRREQPDRGAIDVDPWLMKDGVYMPWLSKPIEENTNGARPGE